MYKLILTTAQLELLRNLLREHSPDIVGLKELQEVVEADATKVQA